jgi:hypothetical protein
MTFVRAAIVAALFVAAAPAAAQHGPLGHYNARLSERDHYNSNGERLRTVAAILRQDRANFHRFNRRDRGDQWDGFFDDANNRAAFERMLARSRMNEAARYVILNGTPMVHVDIYEGYVVVRVD